MQLANHKGSCDAGMVSLPFSHGRKLKVHCLIVLSKPLRSMHAQTICIHMHSHHTYGTMPMYSSALPPQIVPPSLVSVQVACLNALPARPSALWINPDPLPGLFNPPLSVSLRAASGQSSAKLVYSSTLRLNIY